MVCWKKRVSLENPAAYNDVCFITKAIEDSGLPWCNGALGLVKKDGEGIGSGRGDDGRLRFLSITDLDKAGKGASGTLPEIQLASFTAASRRKRACEGPTMTAFFLGSMAMT